jgi:hypothetical protein
MGMLVSNYRKVKIPKRKKTMKMHLYLNEWALIGTFICVLFATSAAGAELERMAYNNRALGLAAADGL